MIISHNLMAINANRVTGMVSVDCQVELTHFYV